MTDPFESHPRRIQDRQHRHLADALYRQIFGNVEIVRVDDSEPDVPVAKALDILGVDYYVKFANDTLLAGQEKFLSYNQMKWRTITVSEHSWKHCAAQIYFVGYLAEGDNGFALWMLVDWAKLMIETAKSNVSWMYKQSLSTYPSFWCTAMDDIPGGCIIARSANETSYH